MLYEEALEELQRGNITDEAIEAAKRALRDCLELGLNGEPE